MSTSQSFGGESVVLRSYCITCCYCVIVCLWARLSRVRISPGHIIAASRCGHVHLSMLNLFPANDFFSLCALFYHRRYYCLCSETTSGEKKRTTPRPGWPVEHRTEMRSLKINLCTINHIGGCWIVELLLLLFPQAICCYFLTLPRVPFALPPTTSTSRDLSEIGTEQGEEKKNPNRT